MTVTYKLIAHVHREVSVLSLFSGESVELRLAGEIGEFLVEQGKKFSVSFECVDADGKVVSLGKIVITHASTHAHMHKGQTKEKG